MSILSEDLVLIIESFNKNSNRTPAQEIQYPATQRKQPINHDMFGNDHVNPLRLLKNDGYNDELISEEHNSNYVVRWFWNTSNHSFPTDEELIRIGIFFRIGFYQTLALVLKGKWEERFSKRMGYKFNVVPFSKIIWDEDLKIEFMNKYGFRLKDSEKSELFDLFEKNYRQVSTAGYDNYKFCLLIDEMIQAQYYLKSIYSDELKFFVDKETKRIEALKHGTEEEKEEFWILKSTWLTTQEDLSMHLLNMENQRLKNANIINKYMIKFGKHVIEMVEQLNRFKIFELQYQLFLENPEITKIDLIEKVQKEIELRNAELDKLKMQEAIKIIRDQEELTNGIPVDDKIKADYLKKCRIVLKELYFLIYPYFNRDENFQQLSELQKQKFKNLWNELLKIKTDLEVGIPENQFCHDQRALFVLLDILGQAKIIVQNLGLDINVRYVIQGETIAEQLKWLEKEIDRLEKEIIKIDAEIMCMKEEKDILDKESILACPDKHEDIIKQMIEKAEEYRKKADELETKLKQCFNEE